MPVEREQELVTVVILAPIAPSLFTPTWLLAQGVTTDRDQEQLVQSVVTPEVAQHDYGWMTFTATFANLQFRTSRVDEVGPLRDVAVLALRALEGTPVSALGINHSCHFAVGGREGADRVGDALAPKDVWGNALRLTGLRSLSLQGVREQQHAGIVNVRIEPSQAVADGIFVDINDHFDLYDWPEVPASRTHRMPDPPAAGSVEEYELNIGKRRVAIDLLHDEWNAADRRATAVFEQVHALSRARR